MSKFEFDMDGNDRKGLPQTTRFKGESNTTYRVSFAWFKEMAGPGLPDFTTAPKFIGANRTFVRGKGMIINNGPEWTALLGEEPKKHIMSVIIVWPTNKKGVIQKEDVLAGEFQVCYWTMDPNKYATVKRIHESMAFGKNDLSITCTDAGFQKMTFLPQEGNFFAAIAGKEDFAGIVKEIREMVQERIDGADAELGRDLTLSELRKVLSGAGDSGSPSRPFTANAAAVDDVLNDVLD